MVLATAKEEEQDEEETLDEIILYAARTGDLELLEEAAKEPSIRWDEIKDVESGNSPLHLASANGHVEAMEALLTKYKLSPNAVNDAGSTALHWASVTGELKAVQCLVQHGVDPTARNHAGQDALFEAQLNSKDHVVQWLLTNVPAYSQATDFTDPDERSS